MEETPSPPSSKGDADKKAFSCERNTLKWYLHMDSERDTAKNKMELKFLEFALDEFPSKISILPH